MPATLEGQRLHSEERRTPYAAIMFGVMLLMAAEGVVLYVLLRKPAPIGMVKPDRTDGAVVEGSSAELMAPTVELPEPVIVSVPIRQGGTELSTCVLSVSIRIGKEKGRDDEVVDVVDLERSYVPKVKALLPFVRDYLIRRASGSTVQDLRDTDTQDKMLGELAAELNKKLKSHGAEQRISAVLRKSFHFD
ncbi:MAG: flagellar basal body-associated FliL family protein [Planctomycetota bacterium]|jgi:hypothetical protein